MWWPESGLILTLNKSAMYQRVLVSIYGLTLAMLWISKSALIFRMGCTFYLMIQGIPLIRQSVPTVKPLRLIYVQKKWFSQTFAEETPQELEVVRLLVNTGLFLLLRLSTGQGCRLLVIFRDQLNEKEWKRLMWLMIK